MRADGAVALKTATDPQLLRERRLGNLRPPPSLGCSPPVPLSDRILSVNPLIWGIIDSMISLKSATEIARELALRVRERRLRRGWTQAELAQRAGVRASTYILFERTGRIAVIRLLKILDVLDLANEFDHIGRQEDLTGMTLAQITQPERKRGTRKRV